jgi:hypothetical protein
MTFDVKKKFGEKWEAGCPVLKVQGGKFYNSANQETDSNANVIVVKPVETEEEKVARLEKVAAEKKLAEDLKIEKALAAKKLKELKTEAKELKIAGYGKMKFDALTVAVAEAKKQ